MIMPIENHQYEILSLNPPLPNPPKTPVRVRKKIIADKRRRLEKLKKEEQRRRLLGEDVSDMNMHKELPSMDTLVKSYLRRHDERMKSGVSPSQSRREEEYYNKLLLGTQHATATTAKKVSSSPSSLHTAMGRKSTLVENAYAFALKQQQVMIQDDSASITEDESITKVESLLREEMRANRQKGREVALDVMSWRNDTTIIDDEEGAGGVRSTTTANIDGGEKNDTTTLPSILHDRPRAIRALNIWSARLSSVPYTKWTIGAATALDHWIAREVLQMSEQTWSRVLEGGGTDAYTIASSSSDILPGGESRRGLLDRMRDIVMVRGALFPETLVASSGESGGSTGEGELRGDLDDDLDLSKKGSATEKSIDELLASLGMDDDDDDDFKFDDDNFTTKSDEENDADDLNGINDDKMTAIMDELQIWRSRNVSSPYESWDADRKTEFDVSIYCVLNQTSCVLLLLTSLIYVPQPFTQQWIDSYITALYPDADSSSVDKEATRLSILSERPIDTKKTEEFWSSIGSETDAELFLKDYRTRAEEKLNLLWEVTLTLTDEDKKLQAELEAILSVPYAVQLDKIVNMGTLRPILDDYAPMKERNAFLEKYAPFFLEGLVMEHLVPDPDGPIGLDDVSADLREELSKEWTPSIGLAEGLDDAGKPRFAIKMVAYGTDEFGTSRAERARELYQLWNEHKANRARFEEALFKRGHLRLEEDGMARFQRKAKKGNKKDKKN